MTTVQKYPSKGYQMISIVKYYLGSDKISNIDEASNIDRALRYIYEQNGNFKKIGVQGLNH